LERFQETDMPIRARVLARCLPVLLFALVALGASVVSAGPQKDTPELVMAGATETASHFRGAAGAMAENDAFLDHLKTDKTYAAAVLAAGQKSDRAGLVTLMKRYSPSGDITVTQLDPDFTFHYKKVVKTDSGDITIEACISTDHKCNGGFASVTLK
jgi:hypothetical protein